MAQDRFFGWADPNIIDQIIQATAQGEFAPEVGTGSSIPEPRAVGSRCSSAKRTFS
jgi:hypothetical protein